MMISLYRDHGPMFYSQYGLQVDELNENIRNALSAAHEAKTSNPEKPPSAPQPTGSNRLIRSQSAVCSSTSAGLRKPASTLKQSLSLQCSLPAAKHADSLSSPKDQSQSESLPSTPIRSPPDQSLTDSLDEGVLRRLIRAKTIEHIGQRSLDKQLTNRLSESLDEKLLRLSSGSSDKETRGASPTKTKSMLKHTLSAQVGKKLIIITRENNSRLIG